MGYKTTLVINISSFYPVQSRNLSTRCL